MTQIRFDLDLRLLWTSRKSKVAIASRTCDGACVLPEATPSTKPVHGLNRDGVWLGRKDKYFPQDADIKASTLLPQSERSDGTFPLTTPVRAEPRLRRLGLK